MNFDDTPEEAAFRAEARAWIDARAQRIYGGTNEIMKELISRTL